MARTMKDAAQQAVAEPRRRPKDRKAQITRAAAQAFGTQGYHATSMEAIATKVGISAPALYRHFPGKYELFAAVVFDLGRKLVAGTDFVDDIGAAELTAAPAAVSARIADALAAVALGTRESGGLYRWQARYLNDADHAEFLAGIETVNRRIQRPLRVRRPELTSPQRWMLSVGVLSVVGSITDHRIMLPDEDLRDAVTAAAESVLSTRLPLPGTGEAGRPAVWRIFGDDTGPYDALLGKSMLLFGTRGYAETSVNQIAEAVGVPASGVYRYFASKGDILATGLCRAADRVAGELSAIVSAFPDPHEALTRLVEAYVATTFANPELVAVYDTERVNVVGADLDRLRATERSMIDTWVVPLAALRPDLDPVRARLAVHAALALLAGLGRLTRDRGDITDPRGVGGSGQVQAGLRRLMESVLLGQRGPVAAQALG